MDPKKLIKNREYVLEHKSGKKLTVIYIHETINNYVFLSNKEMIFLTPAHVNSYINAD